VEDFVGRRPEDRTPLSQPDLIIAATVAHHGLTVVTRDRSDFDQARVPVFSPWE